MSMITDRISLDEAYALYKGNALFRQYLGTGFFVYWPVGIVHTILECRAYGAPDYLEFERDGAPDFLNTDQNVRTLNYAKKFMDQYQEEHQRKASRYTTANELLCAYMEDKHWNSSIFQDKTLLSPMDYARVHKPEHIFKLSAYVAMAVGLQLTITEFQAVISKAGLCLVDGRDPDDAYAFILSALRRYGIDKCNDFLIANHLEPLGTRERNS